MQISYPSGRWLKYSYDSAGRRTQMVDQTGYTVNYTYDSLGNLATLTDGSGNLIAKYTYDTVGRLPARTTATAPTRPTPTMRPANCCTS